MDKLCGRPTPPILQVDSPFIPPDVLQPFYTPVPRQPTLPTWMLPTTYGSWNLNDPPTLFWLSLLARTAYGANDTLFRRTAYAALPSTVTMTFLPYPGTGYMPAYGILETPTAAIVVVSGTSVLAQALGQVLLSTLVNPVEHLPQPGRTNKDLVAHILRSNATLLEHALPAQVRINKDVLFVGHSYGAGIALVCARQLLWMNADRHLGALMFSPPKPGDNYFQGVTDDLDGRRLAIAGDLVLNYPPNINVNSIVIPAPLRAVAGSWGQYRPVFPLEYIDVEGHTSFASEPPATSALLENLLSVAAGHGFITGPAHSIRNITVRLRAAVPGWPSPTQTGWTNPPALDEVMTECNLVGL